MSEASLLVDGLNARIYEKPRRILLPLSNSALAFKFCFKHLIKNCNKLIQGGVFCPVSWATFKTNKQQDLIQWRPEETGVQANVLVANIRQISMASGLKNNLVTDNFLIFLNTTFHFILLVGSQSRSSRQCSATMFITNRKLKKEQSESDAGKECRRLHLSHTRKLSKFYFYDSST